MDMSLRAALAGLNGLNGLPGTAGLPGADGSTTANALATTGASVNVSNAAPPVVGQTPTAITSIAAIWRNPLTLNALLFTSAGTDVQIIQAAVDKASELGINAIVIPKKDVSNSAWSLDSAVLLPSNMTVYLQNCYLKLSDTCRDNFFRSNNIGYGITSFTTNTDIHIIGSGYALLEGASNPRSTGDNAKTLTTGAVGATQSFGTDAGVSGQTQTGDWRNFSIYFGYVDRYSVQNITLKDMHAWGIVPERSSHGFIYNMTYNGNAYASGHTASGTSYIVKNQNGVQANLGVTFLDILKTNCVYLTDDVIALVPLGGTSPYATAAGTYGGMVVTGNTIRSGTLDDTHDVTIDNLCGYSTLNMVRLLDLNGLKIYNITINNVRDYKDTYAAPGTAIKIGTATAYGGSTYGNTHDVTITNVMTDADNPIYVDGALVRANISNILKRSTVNANSCVYYTAAHLGHAAVMTSNLNPS